MEHALGKACNLWGFLDHKRNLKLWQNPAGDLDLVGALLTNIDTCKYGSQVTDSYREILPSVEAYLSYTVMAQTDIWYANSKK
ncbi:unnamed protein product [Discosporangium mesarthrocarpum]